MAVTRCAAYPEYSKVVVRDGRYVVTSRMVAMRHRLSIGTIVSESAMKVQFLRGRTLGSVEENFIARLRPGRPLHLRRADAGVRPHARA